MSYAQLRKSITGEVNTFQKRGRWVPAGDGSTQKIDNDEAFRCIPSLSEYVDIIATCKQATPAGERVSHIVTYGSEYGVLHQVDFSQVDNK